MPLASSLILQQNSLKSHRRSTLGSYYGKIDPKKKGKVKLFPLLTGGFGLLTQPLAHSLPAFLPAARLLQAWQPAHPREAQLLVDVEEEDGQRHDEDAHRGQEADGLRRDWQEEGEGEGTHNDTLIRPHKQTVWIHARTQAHKYA